MAKRVIVPSVYPVPDNWRWVELGNLVSILSGYPFQSELFSNKSTEGRPLIRIRDIVNGNTSTYTSEECPDEYIIHNGDVLIGMDGDFNIAKWKSADALLNQRVCFIKSKSSELLNDYMFYFLPDTLEQINEATPSVTVKHLSTKTLNSILLPLPPLPEQHRIVSRIESLFSQLDEAREKAQEALEGVEKRKETILYKAFTGELTEKWRRKKGISFDNWKQRTVKDVCLDVKVGIVIKPSQYYTDEKNGTAAFRSANVREFHIDDFDWVFLNDDGMKANQRSVVHTGDVLVVRSGNPGTACVVDERFDGYNAIDVLIAVPDKEVISSEYLCAFTNSPIGRSLVAENKRGMALAHFNVSGYSKLVLPLPSLEEQKEIVIVIFDLLEKEKRAKETAERVIELLDMLKKSILSKAFRGELGTNDTEDENAIELLKGILKEQVS